MQASSKILTIQSSNQWPICCISETFSASIIVIFPLHNFAILDVSKNFIFFVAEPNEPTYHSASARRDGIICEPQESKQPEARRRTLRHARSRIKSLAVNCGSFPIHNPMDTSMASSNESIPTQSYYTRLIHGTRTRITKTTPSAKRPKPSWSLFESRSSSCNWRETWSNRSEKNRFIPKLLKAMATTLPKRSRYRRYKTIQNRRRLVVCKMVVDIATTATIAANIGRWFLDGLQLVALALFGLGLAFATGLYLRIFWN